MSDMVKYRAVSFKKDQIAALYFTMSDIVHKYSTVTSSNTYFKLGNQLFVKRSQYIRIKNPLHKQSEKACMCF